MVWPFKRNLFSSNFTCYYLLRVWLQLLSEWTKSYGVTIQMKPLQQYFSHDTIYLVRSSTFRVCESIPVVWPFKWNLFNRALARCYCLAINRTRSDSFVTWASVLTMHEKLQKDKCKKGTKRFIPKMSVELRKLFWMT